ncbi:MAG: lysine--tRNA ligase [Patescibacteria group bacterium]
MAQARLDAVRQQRIEKLQKLREAGVAPYPARFAKKQLCVQVADFLDKQINTAGRIMAIRGHGKMVFMDLADQSGGVQLWFKEDKLGKSYRLLSLLDTGDFIGIEGLVVKTKSGQLSVEVSGFTVLNKTILPLPDKWHGLKDEELRFRKRYLELLTNPEVRQMFEKKSLFWKTIRNFMLAEGFLEVETPVLENVTGGADTTPFVTHHDALDIDVYLRISMGELWQKRLLVGGFEKTFEIGRQFRNEGISFEHLQDYTQMEFYWAYANYEDGMDLVQKLYRQVVKKTFGKTEFKIGDFEVDFAGDWPQLDYVDTVKQGLGIDVLKASDAQLRAQLKKLKIEFEPKERRGRLIDKLWKHIRVGIAGPAFLINHPVEVSPLAKRKTDNPLLTERFQVILAGSEMGNGYSELNDPVDQAERFAQQAQMRKEGDKEAQMHDRDFVEALEYGMPPACGFGVSERLFSFLMDKSARECVMFPLLKPKGESDGQKKTA